MSNSLSGYSSGNQSLSGVFSFSDGNGTIIESGDITTNNVYVNNSSIILSNQLTTKSYVDNNNINLLPLNNIWIGTNNFNNGVNINSNALIDSTGNITTSGNISTSTSLTLPNNTTPLIKLNGLNGNIDTTSLSIPNSTIKNVVISASGILRCNLFCIPDYITPAFVLMGLVKLIIVIHYLLRLLQILYLVFIIMMQLIHALQYIFLLMLINSLVFQI